MTSTPSVIEACIIASVCVGAGMLGCRARRPALDQLVNLAIILTMVVMTVSGWMLLEAWKPYALDWASSTR